MSGTRRLLTAAFAALCLVASAAPAALAAFPNSMAATGDSITQAFNTCPETFRDCPANSWSTGTSATVNSFYLRILERNAAIRGNLNNDARSGAKMSNLSEQVANVVTQRREYVTVEMGANDVCTSSEATMTSVESFRTSFSNAMSTLRERLPSTRISVGSIPNVYNLWSVLRSNGSATFVWGALGICQSMLRNPTSTSREDEERRIRVREREVAFNGVLRSVCAEHANCQYDGDVGYNYRFEAGEVSTNDYFHPSVRGQATIARIEFSVVRF
jgi:lysophospholipase L1-like esterase